MATITGTTGDDKYPNEVEGTSIADQIFGLAGNDTLIGFNGDDELEGGTGADELFGSNGLDYASYRNAAAGVITQLNYGYGAGGEALGDDYYGIEGLIGSAYRDLLIGDDERNVIRGEGGSDDLPGLGGNDLLDGGSGDDTLAGWAGADELRGGSGVDIAYYERSAQAVTVDLAAGKGFAGDAEGDTLLSIEGVFGSDFNDQLSGNAGANRLAGDLGADQLSGGGGADRFLYNHRSESTLATADRILDFNHSQADKISLAGVDANEQATGDQAFRFVGQAQFTGAGQVRFYQQNNDTVIEANTTDATAGAEMRIVLDPLVSLQGTDFVL
jgi:serralysin